MSNQNASAQQSCRTDVNYVVKDEHTLGYIIDAQPFVMGVLAGNKGGHNWINGSVCITGMDITGISIRKATREDFDKFRVVVPSDYEQQVAKSIIGLRLNLKPCINSQGKAVSPLHDLIRLSAKYDGKLPRALPAHYVEWSLHEHRKLRRASYEISTGRTHYPVPEKIRPLVIYL